MTTATALAPEDKEMFDLHEEFMEMYSELLRRWEPSLKPEELPAMISTFDVASPQSVSGYTAVIATVLIDEVSDERIIGLINLVAKALQQGTSQHGQS